MRFKTAAAIVLVAGTVAQAQSITTLFQRNNAGSPGGAVYFDVAPDVGITINGFSVNTDYPVGSQFGFSVYTMAGTHVGNETNMGVWTLRTTGVGTAAGMDQPSEVQIDTTFDLDAGLTYGMALVLEAPGYASAAHHYTNGTGANQFYQTAEVSLTLGSATNQPFIGTPFSPRVWNGTINYTPSGPPVEGACCFPDGTCQSLLSPDCFNQGGSFQGGGTDCATANCPQPGACCLGGDCSLILESVCTAQNGVWDGSASCQGVTCPEAWRMIDAVPEGRSRPAGAIVGDYFYFLGGEPQNVGAWRLDLNEETWEPIASLPPVLGGTGGVSNIAAAAINESIYIVGGWDGSVPYNRLIEYDTTTDSWTEITTDPIPTPIYANATVAHRGKLYVIGGSIASGVLNTSMYVYDPSEPAGMRWSTETGLQRPRQYPGAVVIGDEIYVAGGIGASVAEEYDDVEVFDVATGMWSRVPMPMMRARGGPAAYEVDGDLVVVGGGWSTFHSTSERWDGTSWSSYVPVNVGARTFAYAGNADLLVKAGGWNGSFMVQAEVLSVGTACYANCDGSTSEPILTVDDFTCFINEFAQAQTLPTAQQIAHYANCDGSTTEPILTVDDFTCFINAFAQGCP